MTIRSAVLLWIFLLGCNATTAPGASPRVPGAATRPPRAATVEALQALNLRVRLDPAQAEGAVWVKGQPLLVNREFDFALAFLPGMGPGIAAGVRNKENLAVAARLTRVPRLEPSQLLLSLERACAGGCDAASGRTVHLYALLFGRQDARLHVFLELPGEPGRPAIRLHRASSPRPLEGEDGWLANGGAGLSDAFHSALAALASSQALTSTPSERTVGGSHEQVRPASDG